MMAAGMKGQLNYDFEQFVKLCREERKSKYPYEVLAEDEFRSRCIEKWNELTPDDKAKLNLAVTLGKNKTKNKREKKNPNAPKRGMTAYFFFLNEERPSVISEHPDFKVTEVAKELGRRWAQLDDSTKQKYFEMAEKDKLRYKKEMEEYKKQLLTV